MYTCFYLQFSCTNGSPCTAATNTTRLFSASHEDSRMSFSTDDSDAVDTEPVFVNNPGKHC